jgi:hypothetical protein
MRLRLQLHTSLTISCYNIIKGKGAPIVRDDKPVILSSYPHLVFL